MAQLLRNNSLLAKALRIALVFVLGFGTTWHVEHLVAFGDEPPSSDEPRLPEDSQLVKEEDLPDDAVLTKIELFELDRKADNGIGKLVRTIEESAHNDEQTYTPSIEKYKGFKAAHLIAHPDCILDTLETGEP